MFENNTLPTHQNTLGKIPSIDTFSLSIIPEHERERFATHDNSGIPDSIDLHNGEAFLNYYFSLNSKDLFDNQGLLMDSKVIKDGTLRPEFERSLMESLKDKFKGRYEVINIYDPHGVGDGVVAAFALVEGFDPEQSVGEFLHEHEETFMTMKDIMDEDHEDYFMNLATRA